MEDFFSISLQEPIDLLPEHPDFLINHVTNQFLEILVTEHKDHFKGLLGNTVAMYIIDDKETKFLLQVNVPENEILEFIANSSHSDQLDAAKKNIKVKNFRLVVILWKQKQQYHITISSKNK